MIASDRGIDSIHIRIESAIESLLARQSPVAVDLRLVISMIHVNLHLERIGDQCVNIAKLSLLLGPASLHGELALDLQVMASQADEMIQVAMRAFGARDLPSAESLVQIDQVVNKTNYGLARNIVTSVGDAEVGLFVIVIGRCWNAWETTLSTSANEPLISCRGNCASSPTHPRSSRSSNRAETASRIGR